MSHLPRPITVLLLLSVAACSRGESQFDAIVAAAAERVVPRVEQAVGLTFRTPPDIQIRTREQVTAYLERKFETDLPPERVAGIEAAYAMFGLIPDSMDLRALLLPLYSEQVVGFFDPDSNALYMIDGTDELQVALILAHELVHALQAQYTALDSILSIEENDVVVAAQATMEGQATLAMISAMIPGQDINMIPDFWETYRAQIRAGQEQMPVFNTAPKIVQETLIFPYLEGAIFNNWFKQNYPDTVPYGPRLPVSTEQILHPYKYREADLPVRLRFEDGAALMYQNGLGELETRIMLQELTGSMSVGTAGALGWDGDQYGVFVEGDDHALVWWTVWDNERLADRFEELLASEWTHREAPGRRFEVDHGTLAGQAAVRLIDAPESWSGWSDPPAVSVIEN